MKRSLKQKKKISFGFTLMELMIVVAILGVTGTIVMGILFSVLRGAGRANSLVIVRQNGNFALEQMSRMIRNAKSIDSTCDGTASTTINITGFDRGSTTLACNVGTSPNINIASTSGGVDRALFLDTDAVTLTPNTCFFTCESEITGDPPAVRIEFELSKKGGSEETEETVPFETSVVFRNFNQ